MTFEHGEKELRRSGQNGLADVVAGVRKTQRADIPLPGQPGAETTGTIESLLSQERQALKRFFGREISIPNPPRALLEALRKAEEQGLDLEAHGLPPFSLKKDSKIKGWKVKPKEWFWQKIKEGKIDSEAARIDGGWILVGTNRDGFGRSWDDVHEEDLPRLARMLRVENSQVRLLKAIEFNVLGNVFHPEWGQSHTWEWFEDNFGGGDRLVGGSSDDGGLADVDDHWSDLQLGYVGFRPLVVFSPSA